MARNEIQYKEERGSPDTLYFKDDFEPYYTNSKFKNYLSAKYMKKAQHFFFDLADFDTSL